MEQDTHAEHWILRHPDLGVIEVFTGTVDALGAVDPDFPGTGSRDTTRRRTGPLSSSPRLLIRFDGVVIARCRSLDDVKIDLTPSGLADPRQHPGPGQYGHSVTFAPPMLQIDSSLTRRWVTAVTLRSAGEVVEFDAPSGSRAERRQQAMERSAVKRWLYPVLGGIGKGGWALAVLVLGPVLSRILDPLWRWLASLLPDWHITWPSVPWPDINLPEISLPSVPWPDIDVPEISLPDWHLPWIVDMALDYTKVWVPVLIGIGFGVTAVRNGRKSREKKEEWRRQEEQRSLQRLHEARADLARAMRGVLQKENRGKS
ncbi:MAG: hypothetical protein LKG15_09805 [Corynebacterium provencense]|jgi:hypothetical protein|uniref:hypothetical protein n=1 Tax=Corynebacterium provencense TaxID=1737425 RepID=UPI002989AD91|nr:hypothetical protein [Corynebacterium provencense]